MISETMQEDPLGRQWSVAEKAVNLKTPWKSCCRCCFFFRVKNSLESALFVISCCHFLNFRHSGWNPTLLTPIYSDSFICSNQSNQHQSQTSNDPPGGVPKKYDIWCLIIDLSSLHGSSMYSQLPIIRTFKGNRKTVELSGVRVIDGKIIWKMIWREMKNTSS